MKITVGAFFAMMFMCVSACAQQGTGSNLSAGTYFTLYADGQADAYAVLGKIDANYLVYSSGVPQGSDTVNDILSKTLDGLYQEVSDILDIHIYSFKGTIQVFADRQSLARFFKQTYGMDFNERSIYYFEKDIIYISLADMTVGMLGHEIAHAIISHYFVVPPPAKVQEVLCGYVEYSLRKTRGSLP
jgi:hypothetical protein